MINPNKLYIKDLKKDIFYTELSELIDSFIEYEDVPYAKEILEKLREILGNSKEPGLKKYNELIEILEILVFHTLTDNEAANIFNKKLLFAIEKSIDLIDNLYPMFIVYADDLNDFQLHGKLAQAVASNKELLGKNKIQLKGKDDLHPQSIENWVKDFIGSLPEGKTPTYLEEAEYLNNNQNVKRLSDDEKEILKKVLRIYNTLRYPLRDTGKVQETGHKLTDKVTSPVDGIDDSTFSNNPLESLKQKYNNYRRARWDVLKIEDEILVSTKGDIATIKKELASAAREYNKNKLIACVKMLARQGYLLEAIVESPAWINALGEYIITKYAAKSEPEDISLVVSELKQNYKNPAIVSEFLQYLFIDKLQISQNEAALTAVEIGQMLGKEYEPIAYGNQSNGNFEFTNSNVVDGKLVMED